MKTAEEIQAQIDIIESLFAIVVIITVFYFMPYIIADAMLKHRAKKQTNEDSEL